MKCIPASFYQKSYCRERVVNEHEALPTLKAARPPQVYTGSIEWKHSTRDRAETLEFTRKEQDSELLPPQAWEGGRGSLN